jgi:DNA-binding CsgD family transcriptional regulator
MSVPTVEATRYAHEKHYANVAARLTEAQLVTLAAYVQSGSAKETATELGIALSTVKNHLSNLYARLGVGGAMEAATVLGWVMVPSDYAMCGWLGTCTRKADHRGQHGGFRGTGQANRRPPRHPGEEM